MLDLAESTVLDDSLSSRGSARSGSARGDSGSVRGDLNEIPEVEEGDIRGEIN